MSLDVPTALIERAERGEIPDEHFVAVVRDSLPYAWTAITAAVADLGTRSTPRDLTAAAAGTTDVAPAEFGQHADAPPDDTARGQLLRALASDAIRGSLERHFGVRLAFQNCHTTRAYRPGAVGGDDHRAFTSPRAQVLAQTPELRNC